MRCREGGAGCGTRERDATHVTSPGGGGEPSRGTKTAGRSDRTVEGVKPEMPRGAPSWRGASADAPGSGDPGPPAVIVRAVRRNPDNASSRRVTPSLRGEGKRRAHPAPDPKEGPAWRWLCILRRRRDARVRTLPHLAFVPTEVGTQSFSRQVWPWAPACAGANGENYFCIA